MRILPWMLLWCFAVLGPGRSHPEKGAAAAFGTLSPTRQKSRIWTTTTTTTTTTGRRSRDAKNAISFVGVPQPPECKAAAAGAAFVAPRAQKACRHGTRAWMSRLGDEDDDDDDDGEEEDMEEMVLNGQEGLNLEDFEVDEEVANEADDDDEEEEEEIVEEEYEEDEDDEYEYEYEYEDDEEDYDEYVPLQDDPSDPDYQTQKDMVLADVAASEQLEAAGSFSDGSREDLEATARQVTDKIWDEEATDEQKKELAERLSRVQVDMDEVASMASEKLTASRLKRWQGGGSSFVDECLEPGLGSIYDNPEEQAQIPPTDGSKSDDQQALDDLDSKLHQFDDVIRGLENGTNVGNEMFFFNSKRELRQLDNESMAEVSECWDWIHEEELGFSEDVLAWLLWDRQFNVSNLFLASFAVHPDAPLILPQWLPQLSICARYESVRRRDFNFTWAEDVAQANITELREYYRRLGYNGEIPSALSARAASTQRESNVIPVSEPDDDDIELSAFDNWMDQVYDPERETPDFDSEDFTPQDSPFDENYEPGFTDEDRLLMDEYDEFQETFANETQEWRDSYVQKRVYHQRPDEELQEAFRGLLVVACSASDEDLLKAEQVTMRMAEAFGKQVHVETRVYNHATPSDNLYEVWLESYEVELLHSRRRAVYNVEEWDGPAELDEAQLEYLVDRVAYLISDDYRYSYRMDEFETKIS